MEMFVIFEMPHDQRITLLNPTDALLRSTFLKLASNCSL